MLDKLLFLIALSGTAVVYADVLVRDGMLLAPVQRWLRNKYRWCDNSGECPVFVELDDQWWWPALWGCYKCVAGQWGVWGYLIYVGRHLPTGPPFMPDFFRAWAANLFGWLGRYWQTYSPFEHIAFTAFTILAAIILHKWSQDS